MATFDRGDELKQQGNLCFQKGKFHAAIDMYTEAIVMAPGRSKYYSNRALCYLKLEKWKNCRKDCEVALTFDPLNAKASYILGTSQKHLLAFDAAVKALETALSSAKKTNTITFQQDIRTELQRVKKEQWRYEQKQRLFAMKRSNVNWCNCFKLDKRRNSSKRKKRML
ncbi:unnamed protein product [Peronospora effusa]|uniref:RING-type E3 ubiquitin transferase n=1 Tax=Peronospora effusa TaxID=542832 RepID=A0A3R7XV94_9STRA|nr:hypothetical protein DD237_004471 [Peronospora effusa]CAI5713022.1 unnamed protein product [Peronospora effusa]